jgi:hypothetical protein
MPILESGISKEYYKHFILEEDSLRRTQAIIGKAGKELSDSLVVVFRVEREDDRFYETLSIEDVLADPNIKGRRVEVVYVQLRPTDEKSEYEISKRRSIVNLKFSSREVGVMLEISHDNRNWALLLADEIEPQIQRTFKAQGFSRWLFWPFLIPVGLLTFKILQKISPTEPLRNHLAIVLATIIAIAIVAPMFIAILTFPTGRRQISILGGPESVFLWGDEVHAYNQLQKTRQNFVWGVLVAFLVSFVAGGIWLLF